MDVEREQKRLLKGLIPDRNEPRWLEILEKHYFHGLELIQLGEENEKFAYSALLHFNLTIEGCVKLFKEKMIGPDTRTLGQQINILSPYFTTEFTQKIRYYTRNVRNPSTHDIFLNISQREARDASSEAYYFLIILKWLFERASSDPPDDIEIQERILNAFIKTYEFHFLSWGPKTFAPSGYEIIENMGNIKELLIEFNKSSFFSNFMGISIQSTEKFRKFVEVKFNNNAGLWVIRIIKIDDMQFMHRTTAYEVRKRRDNYLREFSPKIYFLLISNTNRRRAKEFIDEFKQRGDPHHIIDLKNPIYNEQLQHWLGL